jgi:cellulose synthase/poly-beta-1,6-N-acetylglucosamine synthase-like glycosyltransferase
VPLRDEAAVVPELVEALRRLNWPRSRLDVKILLEADDRATIAAARRAATEPWCELIIVPPVGPRTKPKALAFALPLCRGEFVTVYDAEDRPNPLQLREAFAVFRRSPADLVCLQSPLVIDNRTPNWLSRSFAVEYAALFDALLPVLARWRMPLPLGGTSNHFRHAALMKAGGWDPFNVTEDADLGVRLARLGYRCATLELPTLEDAPTSLGTWRRQRTRWFKGWMQTWLVHTRHPIRLARELGPIGFLGFNLVSTGLIVSSLVYPLYLFLLLTARVDPLHFWGDGGPLAASLFGLNLFNLGAAYIAMGLLGYRALRLRGKQRDAGAILLLPLYWLVASFASYRAVFQLLTKPFVWEKTPHRPHG